MESEDIFSPTDGSLSSRVAQFDAELKSYRGTGAAEADAENKESGENSLEEVVALEGDHFLGDQSAEDEDETSGGEKTADCQLHLLPEVVHHCCNCDARPDSNKTYHNAKS